MFFIYFTSPYLGIHVEWLKSSLGLWRFIFHMNIQDLKTVFIKLQLRILQPRSAMFWQKKIARNHPHEYSLRIKVLGLKKILIVYALFSILTAGKWEPALTKLSFIEWENFMNIHWRSWLRKMPDCKFFLSMLWTQAILVHIPMKFYLFKDFF